MPIERFMVPDEMEPVSHYCHVVKSGGYIWLSGMVGVASDGSIPNDTVDPDAEQDDAVDVGAMANDQALGDVKTDLPQ